MRSEPVTQRAFILASLLLTVLLFGQPVLAFDDTSLTVNSLSKSCEVIAVDYKLIVDVESDPIMQVVDPDDDSLIFDLKTIGLEIDDAKYTMNLNSNEPDLHIRRAGPYTVELHIENIVLSKAIGDWVGLAEFSIYCFTDKIYFATDYLCGSYWDPDSLYDTGWIRRTDPLFSSPPIEVNRYVYDAEKDHEYTDFLAEYTDSVVSPDLKWFDFEFPSGVKAEGPTGGSIIIDALLVGFLPTVPVDSTQLQSFVRPPRLHISDKPDTPWVAGTGNESEHEVGVVAVFGDATAIDSLLDVEQNPLDSSDFTTTMGTFLGYQPRDGMYKIEGAGAGTTPPVGTRKGANFTVTNDYFPRTILMDQRSIWSGIAAGIIRDDEGDNDPPLPIDIQFDLNYPGQGEYGEVGGAQMIYPLELGVGDTIPIIGEALYRALAYENPPNKELLFLDTLEPVGSNNAIILHVPIGRSEVHTTRLDDFCITDFRPHYLDMHASGIDLYDPTLGTLSASEITFMAYCDSSNVWQALEGRQVEMIETGPALIEYEIDLESTDGKINGKVRVFQAATSDMTRFFSEIDLTVTETVQLSTTEANPIFLQMYHTQGPKVYDNYCFRQANDSTKIGDMAEAGSSDTLTVHENGTPMSSPFFMMMYKADNYGGASGITISDRAGNPLMLVFDWDVDLGGMFGNAPGAYAFSVGVDSTPAHERAIAVLPRSCPSTIDSGGSIFFRTMHLTGGCDTTTAYLAEAEYAAWSNGLTVTVDTGALIDSFPIHVEANANGEAEFDVSGGNNWIPIRVSGFQTSGEITATVNDSSIAPADFQDNDYDGEPWYNVWETEEGEFGYTFLVEKPAGDTITIEVQGD